MNEERSRPAWWQWHHVVSLDAPAVALCWQWQWSRYLGISLDWSAYVILGLGVWSIYLLDRVIDVGADSSSHDTARHRFASRHRRVIARAGVIIGVSAFLLALLRLSAETIAYGLVLGGLVSVYLLAILRRPGLREDGWSKELFVGLMFALGTAFFPLMEQPSAWIPLAPPLSLFAGLCIVNCGLITCWETQSRSSNRANLFATVAAMIAIISMICAIGQGKPVWFALSLSGTLITMLHLGRLWLTPEAQRVGVDLALLTPIVTTL